MPLLKDDDCSLNLHGYTELKGSENIYSSRAAAGLLVGVGNVGKYLDRLNAGNTFLSRDGGKNWKEIRKGVFRHEFGDQGGILVIASSNIVTDHVL